jgi:hypothetical protein
MLRVGGWIITAGWFKSPDGKVYTEKNLIQYLQGEKNMSAFSMKTQAPGDFEGAPAGSHPAVLVAMIDLGTQKEEYKGETKIARKVFLAWELTGEKKTNGKNFVVGKTYTLSFAKKANLRALVEKWRGKAFADDEQFDLAKLIGKPCVVSIVQNGNYTNVDSASQPTKGLKVEPATYPNVMWELGSTDPFPEHEWLPYSYGKPLLEKIQACEEYKANGKPAAKAGDSSLAPPNDKLDGEIPF